MPEATTEREKREGEELEKTHTALPDGEKEE